MNIQNIFNPVFRQDYIDGYSLGLDPYVKNTVKGKSDAYNFGFNSGRKSYEEMNGPLSGGIPHLIVSEKVLEEFLLAGLLGLKIDTYGYTLHQLNILSKWYQSGIEKYDVKEGLYLIEILEEIGIEIGE
ncbi:MAG: hypothetical protein WCJ62_01125 [Flavobacterium sp.]